MNLPLPPKPNKKNSQKDLEDRYAKLMDKGSIKEQQLEDRYTQLTGRKLTNNSSVEQLSQQMAAKNELLRAKKKLIEEEKTLATYTRVTNFIGDKNTKPSYIAHYNNVPPPNMKEYERTQKLLNTWR